MSQSAAFPISNILLLVTCILSKSNYPVFFILITNIIMIINFSLRWTAHLFFHKITSTSTLFNWLLFLYSSIIVWLILFVLCHVFFLFLFVFSDVFFLHCLPYFFLFADIFWNQFLPYLFFFFLVWIISHFV